jgi:Cytochrome c554 and c-prime
VARKSISGDLRWFWRCLPLLALPLLFRLDALARDATPKILGAGSCASSGCHGGGGVTQNQYQAWSLRDFHSSRPFATLTTARSKQIADALGIKSPAEDPRCTVCHAPLQTVTGERDPGAKISEGITCESCHGPGEPWLRGHTRSDWSHAHRTQAGMRDLKDLYERANTCVACHQTVQLPLLKAGHPELIFELDGQTVSEPRHWRESTNYFNGQAWLVGQAVALRELSWQLTREGVSDPKLNARWQAALWLVQKASAAVSFPELPAANDPNPENAAAALKAADQIARQAAKAPWAADFSRKAFQTLAAAGPDFRKGDLPKELQARRAERLVLGLDRLSHDLPGKAGEAELNALFALAQSIPDFDHDAFAEALEKLRQAMAAR